MMGERSSSEWDIQFDRGDADIPVLGWEMGMIVATAGAFLKCNDPGSIGVNGLKGLLKLGLGAHLFVPFGVVPIIVFSSVIHNGSASLTLEHGGSNYVLSRYQFQRPEQHESFVYWHVWN